MGHGRKGTFIIAEAGVNHNGQLSLAKKMIHKAREVGADAIKFQTFRAERIVSQNAPKALYQRKTTDKKETQFEMIKKLELDLDDHKILMKECKKNGILFLSSAFDLDSLELLEKLALKIIKIPSGEITNLPYLRRAGSLRRNVLLSTGMSDLKEVKKALGILIEAGTPKRNITVLHCHTEYPTAYRDVNLKAMLTMKKTLGVEVGYSDHTPGIEMPIAAAALGAKVIEKHFTLDKNMEGPDHKASLDPSELKAMVLSIRNVEKALGDGVKRPTAAEKANLLVVRKSIVAAGKIKKRELFTKKNMTVKRPGTGLSPMLWDKLIGKRSAFNFKEDDLIRIKKAKKQGVK